ncbi:MAG: PQQ-binding-like beta-propeller repeat protein [Bacteroidales bacterium]|jgi:outer membrane protein assembly factor BamB|nr:PQQ-binding-like beta-propeller repeat protein [Bacteroidales bacterium]
MQNKIIYIIFSLVFCCALNTACDKKPVPPEEPIATYKTKLEVVWTRYFHSDKIGGELFLDPIFWNDHVVISSSHGSHYTKQQRIRVLNKLTGEDHPAWAHEPGGIVDQGNFMECIHIGGHDNNILFTGDDLCLYAVDLNTGQRIWKHKHYPNDGIHKFSMLGNMPLQVYSAPSGGLSTSWCRIAKCDLETGEKTDLVETWIEDNYEFLLTPPAWTTNNIGDTIIMFLSGSWNFELVHGKTKAYCYNITQKRMEWEKRDFTNHGDAGFLIPIIANNDKVIFQTIKSLHCFDIESGDLLWQYVPVPIEGYSGMPMLYRDEKLYIRCVSGKVTCLNPQTGAVIWKTGEDYIPAPDGRMDIYNGKLYLAAWGDNVEFYLYCLSAENGDFIWQDKGPFNKISGGVAIDQNTGYLYCTNNREIMCIDLNKSPKEE